mgnify:CR=1 FL=1
MEKYQEIKQKENILKILKTIRPDINEISYDTRLLSSGLLSSLEVMFLLLELEKEGLKVCHIVVSDIDTVDDIYGRINNAVT